VNFTATALKALIKFSTRIFYAISIGDPRSSLMKFHQLVLELRGDSTWEILPSQKYKGIELVRGGV
jgi:hypothetical protein